MTRGLTLLETLAAVTLLGLVASAVIPLTMRLGQGELELDARLEARRWLLGQGDPAVAGLDLVKPVKGHTGWYLHRRAFFRTSGKPVDGAITPSEHQWVHLLVRAGPQPDAEILAERVVLVTSEAAATPRQPNE
jgi:prepilin-type N-terminal cleavage/methylation domain-containing protein